MPNRHPHLKVVGLPGMITLFLTAFFILGAFIAGAANPLNLTPGSAATVTLGPISNLSAFNTSIGSPSDISYNNSDLATRTYLVRLPTGFDANNPTKKYGIMAFNDAGTPVSFPTAYAAALDSRDIIWIAGNGIDNSQPVNLRRGVTIMGVFRMIDLGYPIDPARIYATGLSGGSICSSGLTMLRNDFFRGFIARVGASLPQAIPGWQTYGRSTAPDDADYELDSFFNVATPSVVFPTSFRIAMMTQYGDFRRSELAGIYRYGHLNHGNTVRFIMRPGGHSDIVGDSFTDAVNFLYQPLNDVIWDRFENANLATNLDVGKTVAGNGFVVKSGSVSEANYAYNNNNLGVVRLTGDGSRIDSNDSFTWQNSSGILLDARLRAETATGQNQQIGLHIIPSTATGSAATQAGFHLYWCYGQPHRAEIVAADGTRKTLATWQHSATHPMNLSATVTSPQQGEGTVQEKTFWNSTVAPDFAGQTLKFRGEDVRLVLNSVGFQLTFNRPATNLTTSYTDKVVAAPYDTAAAPNESFPIVVQAFWKDVETALVNGLPVGTWKLALTNDAILIGQATGNALIDEIRVVGSTGSPATPPAISVVGGTSGNTLTWGEIVGASTYVIRRSDSPDGPFSVLASVPAYTPSYADNTATQPRAYYYTVSAVAVDGSSSAASVVGYGVPLHPIPNFGFETPSQGTGTNAYTLNPSNASWTFTSTAGISANGTTFTSSNNNAPQGSQVGLAQALGYFYQILTGLFPGSNYKLTYAAAIRQGSGRVLQNWVVKRDATTIYTSTLSGSYTSFKPYLDYNVTFSATASSHALVFGGTVNNSQATVFFDNLRLALQPPATPGAAANTFVNGFHPRLTWSDLAADETAYRIERSAAGANHWSLLVGSLASGSTVYTDATASASTAYDYRISAVGPGGLSGYAMLAVTTPVNPNTPLQDWRLTHFGSTTNGGGGADGADPDGDGIANLMEYALGSIPTSPASVSSPILGNSGGFLSLTFTPLRSDVTYVVEGTSDLGNPTVWTPVSFSQPGLGSPVTVVDPTGGTRRFLRLRVTNP